MTEDLNEGELVETIEDIEVKEREPDAPLPSI